MDDRRLRVCLERTIELAEVQLHLRDWPGLAGPLVHVPDPLCADNALVETLAQALTPRYRVLSLKPRGGSPYQVDAADLLATLDMFGFESPVLLAEELGCVTALVLAAWHAGRVAGLVLVDATYAPPTAAGLAARALKDCPPDVASLRQAVQCPVLQLPRAAATLEALETFLNQLAPLVT